MEQDIGQHESVSDLGTGACRPTQHHGGYPGNHCEGESPVDKTARQGQCVNTALSQQRSMPMIIQATIAKENSLVPRRQGKDSTSCTALPKTTQAMDCFQPSTIAKENSLVPRRQGKDSTSCTTLPKTTQAMDCYPSNNSITKRPSMQTDYCTAPHKTPWPPAGFRGSPAPRYRRPAAPKSSRRPGLSRGGGR